GHDSFRLFVPFRERRVQRRRFTGTGGACHEHHTEWVVNRILELLQFFVVKTEPRHVDLQVRLVENTHYDLFAVHGRQGVHPEVDRLIVNRNVDRAVLRQARLGDVQIRHDLDTRDQRRFHAVGRTGDFVQATVDAQAHAHERFIRLDVNIGGFAVQTLHQDLVHQLDDGAGVALRRNVFPFDFFFFLLAFDLRFVYGELVDVEQPAV